MKIYNPDGTFRDHSEDTDFGWYLEDIAIDESLPGHEEHNLRIREISKAHVERLVQKSRHGSMENSLDGSEASIEEPELLTPATPKPSQILPQIIDSIDGKGALESATQNGKPTAEQLEELAELQENLNKLWRFENFKVPSKEQLMSLINPVNVEAKALLSIVSSSKCLSLTDKETSEDVLRSINFRTTNPKHLLQGETSYLEEFGTEPINEISEPSVQPKFNVLLNGETVDLDRELYSEIQNYHATKEDNMLSLMMELIITDLDSNAGDMSEVNHSVKELSNAGAWADTNDLGNSPQSSGSSNEGEENKNNDIGNYLRPSVRYLEPAQRSDILHSIGLSEDIDRSIQSFIDEKSEMQLQLADIKESFRQDEAKVNKLINEAISLEKDLRETAYLENVIQLLKGNSEKVSHGKWPFGIFRGASATREAYETEDNNFIV